MFVIQGDHHLILRTSKLSLHYKNSVHEYKEIFKGLKNENFQQKIFDIFLIFAQNIDCGHTFELLHRAGSNEYPQSSMFWSKYM